MKKLKKIWNQILETPKSSLVKIGFGSASVLLGLYLIFIGLTTDMANTNKFDLPKESQKDAYVLYTIESYNLKDLNFKSITEQEIKISEGQNKISFASSNATNKLKNFTSDNSAQNIFLMEVGAPTFEYEMYSVSSYPLVIEDKHVQTENGYLLFKGYKSYDDMEKGVNRVTFAVSSNDIITLENGKKIKTNVGTIELKPGD